MRLLKIITEFLKLKVVEISCFLFKALIIIIIVSGGTSIISFVLGCVVVNVFRHN
ncbi:unnamed protein product, partial [marine sediment metagenome]